VGARQGIYGGQVWGRKKKGGGSKGLGARNSLRRVGVGGGFASPLSSASGVRNTALRPGGVWHYSRGTPTDQEV